MKSCLFFILCFLITAPLSAQELLIYTENNPPASYMINDRLEGNAVEVVRKILHQLGRPDTIELVPWARGYNLALKQPNVALFSTTRLPQREKLFKWVGPLYSQTWILYKKKGNPIKIRSLDDAKRVDRIGTYRKDAKKMFLEKNGFANLVETTDNTTNIRHLLNGNIDLWISSDYNMPYIADQAGVDPEKLESAYSIRSVDNYIVFSLQTPDSIVHAWQQALDAIQGKNSTRSIRK
ncbi:MAG: transporter substrate-binding domain-containing protein [Pseudomonadota bacterium]